MYTLIILYTTTVLFIIFSIYIFKGYYNNKKTSKFLFYLALSVLFLALRQLFTGLSITFQKEYAFLFLLANITEAMFIGYLILTSIQIYNPRKTYNYILYIVVGLFLIEDIMVPNPEPIFFKVQNIYSTGFTASTVIIYDTIITLLLFSIIIFNFLRFAIKVKYDKFQRNKFLIVPIGILIAILSELLTEIYINKYTAIIGGLGYIAGVFALAILLIKKKHHDDL